MDNKTNIREFYDEHFGNLMVIWSEKGEKFFLGNQVASALEYSKPNKAVRDHIEEINKINLENLEKIIPGLRKKLPTRYKQPKTVFITMGGLTELSLASKMKKARDFRRWVTNDLIPGIESGEYTLTRRGEEDAESYCRNSRDNRDELARLQRETANAREESKKIQENMEKKLSFIEKGLEVLGFKSGSFFVIFLNLLRLFPGICSFSLESCKLISVVS